MKLEVVAEVGTRLGVAPTCTALSVSRATYYRRQQPPKERTSRTSHRALSETERSDVLGVLNSERFVDMAPASVHATLLDEESYLCSVRTMYRILAANEAVRAGATRTGRETPADTSAS